MGQHRELLKDFDKDGDKRLNAAERAAAREFLAVAGVRVDLPGPEQLLADGEAGLPDLLVAAAAFAVKLEVALEV